MNKDRVRAFMAEALIVGAVIGAGNLLIVEPIGLGARRAGAALASMRETIERADALDRPAMDAVAARADWVRAMNERSGDAAQVYQTISAVAKRCGVQVDRVQPTPFVPDARTSKGVSGLGCSIVASGSYEAVARFLEALQLEAGFSAPVAIRLAPLQVQGEPQVQASIESMHRSIDLRAIGEALAAAASEEESDE